MLIPVASPVAYVRFALMVGIIATTALDLWRLVMRSVGVVLIDSGRIGCWLTRRFSSGSADVCVPELGDKIFGRLFCYLCGICYAALLPLFWGPDYMTAPRLIPAFLIGFCLASLSGLTILCPAMGYGFMARRSRNPRMVYALTFAGHAIFAMSLYCAARLYADLF